MAWKNLHWMEKTGIIGAALAALSACGFYGYQVHGSKTSQSEEQVSAENYKHGNKDEETNTYFFKTNDNQVKGYELSFNGNSRPRFETFCKRYIRDNKEQLEGRDYLTDGEAWQLAEKINNPERLESLDAITDAEMDDAENAYRMNKGKFQIDFEIAAPKQPGKLTSLVEAYDASHDEINRIQDKELTVYHNKIEREGQRQKMLMQAADQQYRNEMRRDPRNVRAAAEFNHYRR